MASLKKNEPIVNDVLKNKREQVKAKKLNELVRTADKKISNCDTTDWSSTLYK